MRWWRGDSSGAPAAEEERGDNEFFDVLYRDPVALRTFLSGMTGISTGEVTFQALTPSARTEHVAYSW